MLMIKSKGAIALAAAIGMMTGAAQAANHTVMIVDGGYFPEIVYVAPGDNIVFENWSEAEHVVSGPVGSWASDPIAISGQFMLSVDETTPMTYSGLDIGGIEISGAISFDAPPLAD